MAGSSPVVTSTEQLPGAFMAVRADWMEPLLAFSGTARRAMTVIYEPVAPSASRRRIDSESIKLESDAMAKEDKGRRVSAQHRRHQVAVAEREQELVAGFVEFDFRPMTASDVPTAMILPLLTASASAYWPKPARGMTGPP